MEVTLSNSIVPLRFFNKDKDGADLPENQRVLAASFERDGQNYVRAGTVSLETILKIVVNGGEIKFDVSKGDLVPVVPEGSAPDSNDNPAADPVCCHPAQDAALEGEIVN